MHTNHKNCTQHALWKLDALVNKISKKAQDNYSKKNYMGAYLVH